VPLTDPESGNRWWLYSLIEMPRLAHKYIKQGQGVLPAFDHEVNKQFKVKIRRLENENKLLKELSSTVAKQSREDALTGLSNRRHFEIELSSWIDKLDKSEFGFALLYVDLDQFKLINDTLGHHTGDLFLVTVANMLRRLTTDSDFVARIGGDEFAILKPLKNSALDICGLAEEIIEEMRQPINIEGEIISSGASIGIAFASPKILNPERVVLDADRALYHAKSLGKGRWSYFTEEMHAELVEAEKLELEIIHACKNSEFVVFFQPIIDVKKGRIASAEVLVRWRHPTRGLLSPVSFLDAAAGIGLLHTIDRLVFKELCESLIFLDSAGVDLPRVAINTSAERLNDPSFLHDIRSSGIDPERLIVEILESVSLDNISDLVRSKLDELLEMGVTIAIDDFGTGHASIAGLFKIRPSVLKIDRQFIRHILSDDVSSKLVESMVAIGKSLSMNIVAEGIETLGQAQFLSNLGCNYLQGFYFGEPMSAYDLRKWLMDREDQLWCL
jgi:diguanylate cyclase (GGDEF)-like protein